MRLAVRIKRHLDNRDERDGIVAALFRLGRPDMRAPHAAADAEFVAGVIVPAQPAQLGLAQACKGRNGDNRARGFRQLGSIAWMSSSE